MKRLLSGYEKGIDLLIQRFKSRHDTQNSLHKDLQARLNDLAGQLSAVEVLRQSTDALSVGRGLNRLSTLTDAAESWLLKNKAEVDKSFETALREKAGLAPGPFGPEIRSRLHAMTPGERIKAVQALIQARDGVSLAAILDAPSMLTGLPEADIAKFREQYFQAAAPDIVQARDAYKYLSEHVEAAISTARKAALEYSDPVKFKELEEREAAIKAAQGE